MIILLATTDKVQMVTGQAGDIDWLASYADTTTATPPVINAFGRGLNSVVTATTTDLVAGAASTVRTPEEITIRNVHATISNDITVQYNANGTIIEIVKITLRPGDTLQYARGLGWFPIQNMSAPAGNQSIADQITAAGTDTYLTGSNITIPSNRPIVVGTSFHWRVFVTKSAAGVAAWTVNIRLGTAGSVSDTARVALAQVTNVQTAVVDAGTWEIRATIRGPISSSCIIAAGLEFQHHLATTGLSTVSGADVYQGTSSAFDITTVTQVGLSINPGAAGVFTFQLVKADVSGI